MIQKVIKRDGRTVDFNFNKIEDAIRKAMAQTEKGVDAILAATVADKIAKNGDALMSVEAIQDRVEEELMDSERKEVARVYISYRNSRTIARRAKTREVFEEIIGAKKNDITRENLLILLGDNRNLIRCFTRYLRGSRERHRVCRLP